MKPRFEPRSAQFDELMKKAKKTATRLEKTEPTEGATIGPSHFVTETGGNTPIRTAHYSTNQSLIKVEDVANKGATMEQSNILEAGFKETYPTNESTLGAHAMGSDENPTGLAKQLGATGEQLRLSNIAKSVDRLSRRI